MCKKSLHDIGSCLQVFQVCPDAQWKAALPSIDNAPTIYRKYTIYAKCLLALYAQGTAVEFVTAIVTLAVELKGRVLLPKLQGSISL